MQRACTKVDAESDDEDEYEAAYHAWKTTFELTHAKIRSPCAFVEENRNQDGTLVSFSMRSRTSLIVAYEHENVMLRLPNGKARKTKPFIKRWVGDSSIRCYDSAQVCPPPHVCPAGVYNLWVPFLWESMPIGHDDPEYDTEAVDLFLRHVSVMANHDPTVSEYLLNWIAQSVCVPGVKPGVCLILVGKQGTGKSMFIDALKGLYGCSRVLTTTNPQVNVWGNHNAPMEGTYLLNLSEINKHNLVGNGEKMLKKIITDIQTDGEFLINPKGRDQYSVCSYHRVIIDTNHLDPVFTSEDDRRNLIIRCSDEMKGNSEYFTNLHSAITRPSGSRSIYWWLRSRDTSSCDFTDKPMTSFQAQINECNKDPIQQFMEDFVLTNHDKPFVDLSGSQMLLLFCTWRENNGYKFGKGMNSGTLVKKIVCSLHHHNGCVVKLPRSSSGQKTRYVIPMLRTVLKLSIGSEPAVV